MAPYLGKPIYKGQGVNKKSHYKHDKFDIPVLGIPYGESWESAADKLYSAVPDKIDGYDIDRTLTTKYNNMGFSMWLVVYSVGKEPVYSVTPYEYRGNHILDDNEYHSKYVAILQGIPKEWDFSWAQCADWYLANYTPDKINDTEIDKKYSTKWNNNGIAMYIIHFTKGGGTNGISFGKWETDSTVEDIKTGQQSKKYYSRVMNIPAGDDWKRVSELMLKHVPETINGLKVIRTRADDKGVLGLYITAETTSKFNWTLANFGLKAATSDHFQAQVMGVVGKWEDFNQASLDAIKKAGLIPEEIDGRKVIPTSITYFQSTFGLFIELQVEPGIPWYYYAIGATGGIILGYAYLSKNNITILNKK